jgi:hypothetical protein
VSSVLQALQEREPRLTPAGPADRHAGRDWHAWRWVMAAGFAAGLAGVLLLRRAPEVPPPSAAPLAAPAVPFRPVERTAPVAATRGIEQPPRAHVERRAPPVAPAAPPEAVPGASSQGAVQGAVPAPGAAIGGVDPGPAVDPGLEHVVRVQAVAYAPAPEKRSATLAIDGAPAVTLRQGESARGIEVQLILRDQVYLRYGADVFAAGVER